MFDRRTARHILDLPRLAVAMETARIVWLAAAGWVEAGAVEDDTWGVGEGPFNGRGEPPLGGICQVERRGRHDRDTAPALLPLPVPGDHWGLVVTSKPTSVVQTYNE